jgi:serine/threonine-protein kinase
MESSVRWQQLGRHWESDDRSAPLVSDYHPQYLGVSLPSAAVLNPFPPELQRALVDRYRMERELGQGGMATVYLARDRRHDRLVALKVLRPEVSGVLGAERFAREIAIATKLSHPHILPVFDSGGIELGGGQPVLFYTMPYVAGKSLRERLRAEPQLPVEEAVAVARQVAEALDHAHRQGIVHRDIKPENILLAEGNALVADFGIARALDVAGGERLTETGVALGTPAYMSPEQGTASTWLDGRTDVYALGCVLYEMLAGQPPFTGPTAQAIMARHAVDPVPRLGTLRSTIGPRLERVVTRALAKVPADRFPTAGEFGAALATSQMTGTDRAPTFVIRTRLPRRRLVYLALAGGAGLALAAALLAHVRTRELVDLDPALVAIAPFRVVSADSSLAYLREGMVDLLAAKLGAEAGVRATDPRSVLSTWRQVVGTHNEELGSDAALQLAQRMRAGRLIDGSVVGSSNHLTLSASLLRFPQGRTVATANVEGPLDSLSVLVDRLAARLLTVESGVDVTRLSATSSSLPAIRAFLAGRAAFRRGRLEEAFSHYRDATKYDSTFALAAFEMVHMAKWLPGAWGEGSEGDRAVRLAQAGEGRLSGGDRALLDVWTGPIPTGPEYLERWQAAASAFPDRPEVWYWLGDAYFHNGRAVGVDHWSDVAEQEFRRGWTLDSANGMDSLAPEHSPIFAEPLFHMVALAQMKGDTASVLRLVRLGLSADSNGSTAGELRWHRALALGDSALRAYWADSADIDADAFGRIHQFITATGYGSQDWVRATRLASRDFEANHPGEIAGFHEVELLNGGRPRETRRVLLTDSSSSEGLTTRLRYALFWEQDTSGTSEVARRLERRAASALRPGEAGRDQLREICTVAIWRAGHGDFAGVPAATRRLRGAAIPGVSSGDSLLYAQYATLCASLLDAMRSSALRLPDARAKLAEADDASRTYNLVRSVPANLIVARVAEAQGDFALALKAVRRRDGDFATFQWYLSTFLREEGRLAALTGDTVGAVRAYQHFLMLRSNPEPEMRGESEQVREQLAKLIQEPGR